MHILTVRNVNHALPEALWWLHAAGLNERSRNGPVLVAPGSVAVSYTHPRERVLFSALRDCNPYFHLFESLWMLGGHEDVAFPAQFNPRMREYSDDGRTLHGAYGHRWRHWEPFGVDTDQLQHLVKLLRQKPDTRQAVLSMWSATYDLGHTSKDLPCNTHCYLDRRGENQALNLLVCCRSNDAIWGAYGANAVHFSYLLEYLAAAIGCPVGRLDQLSFNLHVYTENEVTRRLHHPSEVEALGAPRVTADDRYVDEGCEPYGLLGAQAQHSVEEFDEDLECFLSNPGSDARYHCSFFEEVAAPMYASWAAYKAGNLPLAQETLDAVEARDWAVAAHEWLQRRLDKRASAAEPATTDGGGAP